MPCAAGELALLYSKPRAANVVARTDGVLWALDRRSFRAILMRSSDTTILRTLRSVQMFKSLSSEQLRRLADCLTEVSFPPGARVIHQGALDFTFYIIREGHANVYRTSGDGHTKLLTELGSGDYFGERAMLYHEPRDATVSVPSGGGHLKCLQISKDAFEEVPPPPPKKTPKK